MFIFVLFNTPFFEGSFYDKTHRMHMGALFLRVKPHQIDPFEGLFPLPFLTTFLNLSGIPFRSDLCCYSAEKEDFGISLVCPSGSISNAKSHQGRPWAVWGGFWSRWVPQWCSGTSFLKRFMLLWGGFWSPWVPQWCPSTSFLE